MPDCRSFTVKGSGMKRKAIRQLVLFLINLIYMAAATASFGWVWYRFYADKLWKMPFWRRGNYVIVILFFIVFFMMARLYGSFRHQDLRISEVIYSNAVALLTTGFLMYIVTWLLMRHLPPVWPSLAYVGSSFVVGIPWAWASKTYIKKVMPPEKLLLLYDNEEARANGEYIIRKASWRFELLGQRLVTDDVDEVLKELGEHKTDAIMVCGLHSTPRNAILKYCVRENIKVYVRPNIGDFLVNYAEEIQMANLPVFICQRADPGFIYIFVKRLADIVLGLAGFVVFSPFMLAAAIAIKLYDHGPVLYSQVRLTKDRKEFKVYKFRSMRVDAEKDGIARLSSQGDDRITPVGKIIRAIRVDEMPQIFCILKGDMSIVGPRPERPSIASDYEKEMPEFALRLQVKAGLTGYAQVYGKYNTEPYDKLQMDLLYISRQSLATDFKIILMTIKILFMPESTEGVASGQTTAMSGKKRNS